MIEKVIRIISREEEEELDIQYWKTQSMEEKLSTLQLLREEYFYLFKEKIGTDLTGDENRKRLRRVYNITK